MNALLDMGGYGVFIWPAYGITLLALGGMIAWVAADWRQAKARLAGLEPARHGRPEEIK